jgi:hypothetical protein
VDTVSKPTDRVRRGHKETMILTIFGTIKCIFVYK